VEHSIAQPSSLASLPLLLLRELRRERVSVLRQADTG